MENFLSQIYENNYVKVSVARRAESLCAAEILIPILKKNFIKFEVVLEEKTESEIFTIFIDSTTKNNVNKKLKEKKINNVQNNNKLNGDLKKNTGIDSIKQSDENFMVKKINNKVYIGRNSNTKYEDVECTCIDHQSSVIVLYLLAKKSNSISKKTLYAVLTFFSFFRLFSKNECSFCKILYKDVELQCEKYNIKKKEIINLPFLTHTNLYRSLYNDVNYFYKFKTFYSFNSESRMKEKLAKYGISRRIAEESYLNLDSTQKSLIFNNFDTKKEFIFPYNKEVTPIENFFLLSHSIESDNTLSIFEKKINEETINYYFEKQHQLKKNIKNCKRIKNEVFLFIENLSWFEIDIFYIEYLRFLKSKNDDSNLTLISMCNSFKESEKLIFRIRDKNSERELPAQDYKRIYKFLQKSQKNGKHKEELKKKLKVT